VGNRGDDSEDAANPDQVGDPQEDAAPSTLDIECI
jgi:hypothetical protein